MIELQGKRNSAIIYADKIDKETKTQISALLRLEALADSKIRIMPDTHSGRGTVVGTTLTLDGRVIPSLLGVDLGCGMEIVFLEETEADLVRLDQMIHGRVPCGAKVHDLPVTDFPALDALYSISAVNCERALRSIATLGGGNHFIELDRATDGRLVLVIHSGSRQLGSDVATYYKEQAYRYQCKKARRSVGGGRGREEYAFKSARREQASIKVSRETAALEGELFAQYLHDLAIVQAFADLNRRIMAEIICDGMDFHIRDRFACVHNYIDVERMILRKGAISARLGERVIIPLNMRDGAIIGRGLGNPNWNHSAPHGAGRVCSRTDAKFAYTVEEYAAAMAGIYTTTATEGSLDECPMVYKAPERILEAIGDTVEVEQIVRPVYNFKAC
ncbi:MAG: RtcB family protein [Clostridia bacterium]|nr:RtcB family protein [Clostridia bacterium]